MSDFHYEEEEFDAQMNGQTVKRIVGLVRPYWLWVAGFVFAVAVVAVAEGTFAYINALIIDEAILANDMDRLVELIGLYALLMVLLAVGVFGFIVLASDDLYPLICGDLVGYDVVKGRKKTRLKSSKHHRGSRTPVDNGSYHSEPLGGKSVFDNSFIRPGNNFDE
ncbi:MAG: hypothetical protein AAF438_20740 [Pseudomonadota bacterium]